jgi:two-component system chemotaxis sensor kinase CheA
VSLDASTRSRLVSLFVDEAQETVASLEPLAERIGGGPEPEAVGQFGRAAHGLKGAASALGFDDLVGILHELEALSLRLDGDGPARRAERHGRLCRAVGLLARGIAEMSASGRDGFPAPVVAALRETLGASAPMSDTAAARGAVARAPDADGRQAGEAVVERLSVPADEVDEALRLAASLARGAAMLEDRLGGGGAAAQVQGLAEAARRLEASIAALRLVPAEMAFSGLEAEAGQLAARLGRQARLEIQGREVRADRRTLQTARGLVRHLLRNALDHGVEPPEERLQAGKPRAGNLWLKVETAESVLRVALEDDGRGFDVPAIRREMERRSGAPEAVAALSEAEVLQRFANEGGSTRESASEISGRGLGLSAVAAAARASGGSLEVATRRGKGSVVSFTLPLDVYAVEALSVRSAGRLFGIPLSAVERSVCLGAAAGGIHRGPTGRTLAIDEGIVPLAALAEVLGLAGGDERFAVVVRSAVGTVAFGVEEVGEVAGVVPATVPGLAQTDALVTGLARLADGSVMQILDARHLVAAHRADRPARAAARPAPAAVAQVRGPALEVVLAEDSPATREVLRVLLEQHGLQVRLAADGDEALARIGERLPDVLVTDINMPRLDGLALTRRLRDGAATARLPVILLTSQDDAPTRAAGAAAGADAYLVKSRFDASVLLETLGRIGIKGGR